MSNYDDFNTDSTPNREPVLTETEHKTKTKKARSAERVNVRDTQKVDKEWVSSISKMDEKSLIEILDTLPMTDRRCINNTSTVNRRELVLMHLAKVVSGKSIRSILVEACIDIVKNR